MSDRRPRLLDTYCKAGGASMGYHLAGFDVVGVDIDPQPHYPFEFMQADALDVLADLDFMSGFDAVAGSPPCQAYTDLAARTGKTYPDLLAATRERMQATGLPYVIENVEGAPLRAPLWLCGTEFGLKAVTREGTVRWLRRHRGFETNFFVMGAGGCNCAGKRIGGVYGVGGGGPQTRGHKFRLAEGREAMGIDWMTQAELSQAIPPAYTLHIGEQLLSHIESGRAAA